MEKKKSVFGINNRTLILVAVGVGTANGVALDDPAIGFGITLFIIGMVFLGRLMEESRRNMKADTHHNED